MNFFKYIFYLLLILLLLGTVGCMTEKKMSRITNEYLDKHPEILAEKCADEFPVKDSTYSIGSIVIDSTWGDSRDYKLDSVRSFVPWSPIGELDDTLYKVFESGYKIGFEVAKQKCIEKPFRVRVDTVKLRDRAYEQMLSNRIESYNKLYTKETGKTEILESQLKKSKKQRNIYLIILIVVGVGAIGLTYKKITGFFGFK